VRHYWVQTVALLCTLLSACEVSDPPLETVKRDFALVIPVYNSLGLEHARSTLAPHLSPHDRFMVVSGNTDGEIDLAWTNTAVAVLRESYPEADILVATSGLWNLSRAAQGVSREAEAIVYIYEPNFPNQPEFTWDFDATLELFARANEQVRRAGFRAVGKPTGRPILQSDLQKYSWDYGRLASTVDELFIQTQTYCKDGLRAFSSAIREVSAQVAPRPQGWFAQVTVDPEAPNGTSVARAQACTRTAEEAGLPGLLLWWSPSYVERAVAFLEGLNEDAPP